ncbi:MAG: J domain-containing protein [Deltaproteobacteria bacterium]|nr:J domain-containing protein [Deltaproteobacteria bacterium]
MSLTPRFMNLAKANLNALLDRVADGDTGSLDSLTDEELEAELLRRQARREREEELRQMRAESERAARARAAATGTSTGTGSSAGTSTGTGRSAGASSGSGSSSSGSGSGSGGGRARGRIDPRRLAELYQQLEVPIGADLTEVKASYRRLMRKYHPDRYPNDPQRAATATELTQRLAQAYRELEAALRDTRPSGKRM